MPVAATTKVAVAGSTTLAGCGCWVMAAMMPLVTVKVAVALTTVVVTVLPPLRVELLTTTRYWRPLWATLVAAVV